MLHRLIKTRTRFDVNIFKNGISLYVISPEIGELITEERLACYLFKNYDDEKDNKGVTLKQLVKYFAIPERQRKKGDLGITTDFYRNILSQVKSEYVDNILFKPTHYHTIEMNSNWLYYDNGINLDFLFYENIKNGNVRRYEGVYNTELINTKILPILKAYSAGLIKVLSK